MLAVLLAVITASLIYLLLAHVWAVRMMLQLAKLASRETRREYYEKQEHDRST